MLLIDTLAAHCATLVSLLFQFTCFKKFWGVNKTFLPWLHNFFPRTEVELVSIFFLCFILFFPPGFLPI